MLPCVFKCIAGFQNLNAVYQTVRRAAEWSCVALFVVYAGYLPLELGTQEGRGELHPVLPGQPSGKRLAMDDNSSLGKVSSSTESVATVTSEEFVLVQSSSAGSPQGSEGKPRLKVGTAYGCNFIFNRFLFLAAWKLSTFEHHCPSGFTNPLFSVPGLSPV